MKSELSDTQEESVCERCNPINPDDVCAEDALTYSSTTDRSDIDWRLVPERMVRWCLSGTKDGAFMRLIVLELFFCRSECGYVNQSEIAKRHGVLKASINKMVRKFEKEFGLSLPVRKSDDARKKYACIVRSRAAIRSATKPVNHLCNAKKCS